MQKLKSIRKGQIWINVLKTDDDQTAITICKSYPTTEGWKQTNFLRAETGDIKNLLQGLKEFHEEQKSYEKEGEFPSLSFCRDTKLRGGEQE